MGSGGFGRVWKAWDERLRVDVALKEVTLSQAGSGEERTERVNRAVREARNAAGLRTHPNIVAVHDVVREAGVPWIVMELVTGDSLEEEIRERGRIPAAEVRGIAQAVLEALRAAHAAGIVHRDVKPSNVMLADDGRALLADFGIAVHDADTALTATGGVIGSLEYIAPERIANGDDGPAGDLFSLGVTLYQAVEGVSPFRRTTPTASVAAVMAHEPDPPTHAGELAGLLMRLLD
ncbi:serine/threonine-protein kinase, partial [Streptomyces sp. 2MCAF27]